MLSIQKNSRGAVFKVLVKPRSFKNMLTGLHDDALEIKLTAPPVNNAANRMCIKFHNSNRIGKNPLTNLWRAAKNNIRNIDAGWSSLVARRAHNPKVGSSNLSPATNEIKGLQLIAVSLFSWV